MRRFIEKLRTELRVMAFKFRRFMRGRRFKTFIKFIKKNLALIITLLVFLGLLFFRWYIPYFTLFGFVIWNEDSSYLDLEFYEILVFVGAIATLFWTDIRVKKVDKQYQQVEDNAFLSKVNTIYLEVVKVLSNEESRIKEDVGGTTISVEDLNYKAINLINSIQASIDSYYQNKDEKEKNKIRRKVLNFFRMNLIRVNLIRANLTGADLRWADLTRADLAGANLRGAYLHEAKLQGTDLRVAYLEGAKLQGASLGGAYLEGANLTEADLKGARLQGAKFLEADVKGTDFTGAENIDKAIDLHSTKHLDQAKGIPEPLYSQLLKDWNAYWEEKGGHPKG